MEPTTDSKLRGQYAQHEDCVSTSCCSDVNCRLREG